MYKLAIDTSSSVLSLAIFKEDNLIAIQNIELSQQHGQAALPEVEKLLTSINLKANDITQLIISLGPGSYTGLRVGLAMAKIWTVSLSVDLHSISSLALMAAASQVDEGLIIPIIDARRMTAYIGGYQYVNKQWEQKFEECHADWQSWLTANRQYIEIESKITLVGHKIDEFSQRFKEIFGQMVDKIDVIDHADIFPNCQFALQVPNKLVEDVDLLAPNYLQMTLAEREWLEKNKGEEDLERLVEIISE